MSDAAIIAVGAILLLAGRMMPWSPPYDVLAWPRTALQVVGGLMMLYGLFRAPSAD